MDNLDYFAGLALVGILAAKSDKNLPLEDREYTIALVAYGYAYAMLRARKTLAPSKEKNTTEGGKRDES